jgi:hypothetical protein
MSYCGVVAVSLHVSYCGVVAEFSSSCISITKIYASKTDSGINSQKEQDQAPLRCPLGFPTDFGEVEEVSFAFGRDALGIVCHA